MKKTPSNNQALIKAIASGDASRIDAVQPYGGVCPEKMATFRAFAAWLRETYPDDVYTLIRDLKQNLARGGTDPLAVITTDRLREFERCLSQTVNQDRIN